MKYVNNLKPGEIRITPVDNRLCEMPPYKNNIETIRPWFKRVHKGEGSLRRCAGINDFFNTGITIPSWTNFAFRPGENGSWETRGDRFGHETDSSSVGAVESFLFSSTGECPVTKMRSSEMENAQFPKLVNPWKIETAPGWSVMFLPTLWEPDPNYSVLPAVVHTDFYHTANIVLNITGNAPFSIKYGTPLAHLIPFERKNNIHKLILQDESMFKYVASKGFGSGHTMPVEGTAAPYRRERLRIDKELQDSEPQKPSIFSRFFSDKI